MLVVVMGGQYGSESKGKVSHFLARRYEASAAVRIGGSNAGHTSYDEMGRKFTFRQLPTAALENETLCVLAAGSYIDPEVLEREIGLVGLSHDRLIIDPYAFVIEQRHKDIESANAMSDNIGSTQSGTGAAVVDRVQRNSKKNLAMNHPYLSQFTEKGIVQPVLRSMLDKGNVVIIEGTQGFGLSNIHSTSYPYATSRDTTAATFVGEVGLSPLDVSEIWMVVRSFSIRVGGNSGPLEGEINWKTVAEESDQVEFVERTTVTNKVRRVGRFDSELVKRAIDYNQPTHMVLSHCDYFDSCISNTHRLTKHAEEQVELIEYGIGRSFDWLGTSPQVLIPRNGY